MHPFVRFESKVLKTFRMDLQLHFFWSFTLTILGVFWFPLFWSGVGITIIKETLDFYAGKGWSWGDFWFGIAGSCMAYLFYLASSS